MHYLSFSIPLLQLPRSNYNITTAVVHSCKSVPQYHCQLNFKNRGFHGPLDGFFNAIDRIFPGFPRILPGFREFWAVLDGF